MKLASLASCNGWKTQNLLHRVHARAGTKANKDACTQEVSRLTGDLDGSI